MGSSLQPGPFLMGTQADVTIAPGNYGFTADAEALSGELLGISADWDSFVGDLGILAAGPADPTLGIDDGALLIELANEGSRATLPELTIVIDDLSTADSLLGIAIGFAPTAAWTNPTMPFVPPDPNATIVVPTIPLGDFNPNITGIVGAPPGTATRTVTLQNLTRVGSLAFVVGDTFLATATGNPGDSVSVDGILNGMDFGQNVLGTILPSGVYTLSGVEGPDAVGSWVENWYVGGVLVATFSFIVSPG